MFLVQSAFVCVWLLQISQMLTGLVLIYQTRGASHRFRHAPYDQYPPIWLGNIIVFNMVETSCQRKAEKKSVFLAFPMIYKICTFYQNVFPSYMRPFSENHQLPVRPSEQNHHLPMG